MKKGIYNKTGKYNPEGIDLLKGKTTIRAGYKKGSSFPDINIISDIVLNGGLTELRSQSKKDNGVETIELTIHFVPTIEK